MSNKRREFKGIAVALTFGLTLWGAAGKPGRLGIVLCCTAIAACIWYEFWRWAVGSRRSPAEKIGRSLLLTVVAFGGAAWYGWQFWPKWKPVLHITGYSLYAQTVGTPLRIGIYILNDSDDTIITTNASAVGSSMEMTDKMYTVLPRSFSPHLKRSLNKPKNEES